MEPSSIEKERRPWRLSLCELADRVLIGFGSRLGEWSGSMFNVES